LLSPASPAFGDTGLHAHSGRCFVLGVTVNRPSFYTAAGPSTLLLYPIYLLRSRSAFSSLSFLHLACSLPSVTLCLYQSLKLCCGAV
jgi:hypothetical protein